MAHGSCILPKSPPICQTATPTASIAATSKVGMARRLLNFFWNGSETRKPRCGHFSPPPTACGYRLSTMQTPAEIARPARIWCISANEMCTNANSPDAINQIARSNIPKVFCSNPLHLSTPCSRVLERLSALNDSDQHHDYCDDEQEMDETVQCCS